MSVQFGQHTVPVPGFGAMGLSAFYGATDFATSQEVLRKAIEIVRQQTIGVVGGDLMMSQGCTFWNTADMYANGANEELIGSVLREGDNRSKVFLVTKYGNRWTKGQPGWVVDGSKAYTESAIDASIARLGFAPDAWALHRIDPKVPIEESVTAMEAARQAGKTKYIGLSECSAATLRKANKVAKIDFIEVEYSPWTLDMETNGVLATAKELGVVVLAYSPLGRGFLTGRYKTPEDFKNDADFRSMLPRMQKEVFAHNYKIVTAFEEIAARKGCTSGQLALAWLLAQGDNIIPIPGTKSEKYLIENFAAREINLSPSELAEVRKAIDENRPQGDRYTAPMMKSLEG